jgi:hypothetical protein
MGRVVLDEIRDGMGAPLFKRLDSHRFSKP